MATIRMIDLMDFLPDYYDSNAKMQELQQILSEEVIDLDEKQLDLLLQAHIQTATTELERHETIHGLLHDATMDYSQQRERLAAKQLGVSTVNAALIEQTAASYTNAEVEVVEVNADYTVQIIFVGTLGVPKRMQDVRNTIRELVPAHLAIEYVFIYNQHAELAALTHGALAQYTHYQLRNDAIFRE